MEVICQQFLISCNKNQKVQRLTISWYQGNVGPVDPQQSGFCGVMLSHIEKGQSMSVVTLLLSPLLWKDKFFSRILSIHFLVHLMVISRKQTRIQSNMQLMQQKNLQKMLIGYHFDIAKCFLTNYSYMWCVILIPGYPNGVNQGLL